MIKENTYAQLVTTEFWTFLLRTSAEPQSQFNDT